MSIRETIEDAYAAYANRDLERTMRAFAENIVYEWPVEPGTAAWSGKASGRNGMVERLSELASAFDFRDFRMLDLITEGDRAAARVVATLHSKATDQQITVQLAHFWRFENGLCAEFSEYYDSALLAAHS